MLGGSGIRGLLRIGSTEGEGPCWDLGLHVETWAAKPSKYVAHPIVLIYPPTTLGGNNKGSIKRHLGYVGAGVQHQTQFIMVGFDLSSLA